MKYKTEAQMETRLLEIKRSMRSHTSLLNVLRNEKIKIKAELAKLKNKK